MTPPEFTLTVIVASFDVCVENLIWSKTTDVFHLICKDVRLGLIGEIIIYHAPYGSFAGTGRKSDSLDRVLAVENIIDTVAAADLIILQLSRPGKIDRFIDEDEGSEPLDFDRHRILKVAKNKEGRRGKVKLAFVGNRQSFYIAGQEPDSRRPSDRKKKEVGNPGQMLFEEIAEDKEAPF